MIEPRKYKTVTRYDDYIHVEDGDDFVLDEQTYRVMSLDEYSVTIAKVIKLVVPNENYEQELEKYNKWLEIQQAKKEQDQINTNKLERETLKRLYEKYKDSFEEIVNA